MIFTILLAEDEPVEMEALHLFLERTFTGRVRIEEAKNGIELEEKIGSFVPDVVIADIEMPGISGLAALSRTRKKGVHTRIIIQSAYSQFDYARQAIDLEVDAYLLKPIRREELKEKLLVIFAEIETEKESKLSRHREMKLLENSGLLIENDIITSIKMGENPGELFHLYTDFLGMKSSSFFVCTFGIPAGDDLVFELSSRPAKDELSAAAREIGTRFGGMIAGPVANNSFSTVLGVSESSAYRRRVRSLEIVEALVNELTVKSGTRIGAGIGLTREDTGSLALSFRQSLQALQSPQRTGAVLHFGDLEQGGADMLFPEEWVSILTEPLAAGDEKSSIECAQTLIGNDIDWSSMPLSLIKDRLLMLLIRLWGEVSVCFACFPRMREALPRSLESLEKAGTAGEVREWFLLHIRELSAYSAAAKKSELHVCVRKAMDLIVKSYMKDLSLELVAEEVGVSPYHLSHLFKQELGTTYIGYLTSVRMKAVDELVETGHFSLNELSGMVGYRSPSYLVKVFQKYTGYVLRETGGICRKTG